MRPDQINWSDLPEVQPMSLAELRAAIHKAKKVVVYVPIADFYLEVEVQKTKLFKALAERTSQPQWENCTCEAEWLDETTLLVGGERNNAEECEPLPMRPLLPAVGYGAHALLARRKEKQG